MAENNEIARERFLAFYRRARFQNKKTLIVEGKSDAEVYHHMTTSLKEGVICKDVSLLEMPTSALGNKKTIVENQDIIDSSYGVAAAFDSDLEIFRPNTSIIEEYESSSLFPSDGSALENYFLLSNFDIPELFMDYFGENTSPSLWSNSIQKSVNAFSSLSYYYYRIWSEGLTSGTYHSVRDFGIRFFNRQITSHNDPVDTLRIMLEEEFGSDLVERSFDATIENPGWVDCKLVIFSIMLSFKLCGCNVTASNRSEIERRFKCYVGRHNTASHIYNSLEHLESSPIPPQTSSS